MSESTAENIRDGLTILLKHGEVEVGVRAPRLSACLSVGELPSDDFVAMEKAGWSWNSHGRCWFIIT